MKVYRIYTEDVNREEIKALADETLPAYTLFNGEGRWRGVSENSIMLEYIDFGELFLSEKDTESVIKGLARSIKTANKQQAVLVTIEDERAEMV